VVKKLSALYTTRNCVSVFNSGRCYNLSSDG